MIEIISKIENINQVHISKHGRIYEFPEKIEFVDQPNIKSFSKQNNQTLSDLIGGKEKFFIVLKSSTNIEIKNENNKSVYATETHYYNGLFNEPESFFVQISRKTNYAELVSTIDFNVIKNFDKSINLKYVENDDLYFNEPNNPIILYKYNIEKDKTDEFFNYKNDENDLLHNFLFANQTDIGFRTWKNYILILDKQNGKVKKLITNINGSPSNSGAFASSLRYDEKLNKMVGCIGRDYLELDLNTENYTYQNFNYEKFCEKYKIEGKSGGSRYNFTEKYYLFAHTLLSKYKNNIGLIDRKTKQIVYATSVNVNEDVDKNGMYMHPQIVNAIRNKQYIEILFNGHPYKSLFTLEIEE